MSRTEGIETRHSKKCASRDGGRCNCQPTYQANVWLNREQRRVRKTFPTMAAAKSWRRDAQVKIERGKMRPPMPQTLAASAEEFMEGALNGSIRTRTGTPYKPSTLRGTRTNLNRHILPVLGDRRMSDIRRLDLQDLAEDLLITYPPNTVYTIVISTLAPIFDRAIFREQPAVNPLKGLRLPSLDGPPKAIMSREHALSLIDAAPRRTGRCGRRRSTPGCALANSRACSGRTSTSSEAGSTSAAAGISAARRSRRSHRRAGARSRSWHRCAST